MDSDDCPSDFKEAMASPKEDRKTKRKTKKKVKDTKGTKSNRLESRSRKTKDTEATQVRDTKDTEATQVRDTSKSNTKKGKSMKVNNTKVKKSNRHDFNDTKVKNTSKSNTKKGNNTKIKNTKVKSTKVKNTKIKNRKVKNMKGIEQQPVSFFYTMLKKRLGKLPDGVPEDDPFAADADNVEKEPFLVGTDFSGADMPIEALRDMDYPFVHVFSSEIDPACIQVIRELGPPTTLYIDILTRTNDDQAPYVDVYFMGPPCQGFSALNGRKGWSDPRNKVFMEGLRYIGGRRPKLVIMENVATLAGRYKNFLVAVVQLLEGWGYQVHYKVMNTQEHGLPQSRTRVYVVALKKSYIKNGATFEWPTPFEKIPSMQNLLDDRSESDGKAGCLPCKRGAEGNRARVKDAYADAKTAGLDPTKDLICIDFHSSKKFATWRLDVLPCVTRRRAMTCGYWNSVRGRPFSLHELARSQGFREDFVADCFRVGLCKTSIGSIIGNTMSKNILQRLLPRALYAVGLGGDQPLVQDAWEHYMKQSNLIWAGKVQSKRKRAD